MKLVFNECTSQEGSCGGGAVALAIHGVWYCNRKEEQFINKGYDGTTQGGSGGEGTSWSEERIKWPIEQYSPPPAIPFKVIDVYYIYVTLINIHLAKSAI